MEGSSGRFSLTVLIVVVALFVKFRCGQWTCFSAAILGKPLPNKLNNSNQAELMVRDTKRPLLLYTPL